MVNFTDIMDAWKTRAAFAEDMSVSYNVASAWYRRKRIPPEYWKDLTRVAQQRGIAGVTLDALAEIVARDAAKENGKEVTRQGRSQRT